MVVAFCQHYTRVYHIPHNGQLNARLNLGIYLLNFFDFYSHRLNFLTTGISLQGAGSFYSKREVRILLPNLQCDNRLPSRKLVCMPWYFIPFQLISFRVCLFCFAYNAQAGKYNESRPFLLSIENPCDPSLDVGANAWAIQKVRKAFGNAHEQLKAALIGAQQGPRRWTLQEGEMRRFQENSTLNAIVAIPDAMYVCVCVCVCVCVGGVFFFSTFFFFLSDRYPIHLGSADFVVLSFYFRGQKCVLPCCCYVIGIDIDIDIDQRQNQYQMAPPSL